MIGGVGGRMERGRGEKGRMGDRKMREGELIKKGYTYRKVGKGSKITILVLTMLLIVLIFISQTLLRVNTRNVDENLQIDVQYTHN